MGLMIVIIEIGRDGNTERQRETEGRWGEEIIVKIERAEKAITLMLKRVKIQRAKISFNVLRDEVNW